MSLAGHGSADAIVFAGHGPTQAGFPPRNGRLACGDYEGVMTRMMMMKMMMMIIMMMMMTPPSPSGHFEEAERHLVKAQYISDRKGG